MALTVSYRYKQQVPDEAQRRREAMKVKESVKLSSKIPLVVGRVTRSNLPELASCKFLFPANAKVSDLCQYINEKTGRPDGHAPLFIYAANEVVLCREAGMAQVYQEYREADLFLYLAYYEENVYAHRE